jgi:hypothetical protein
MKSLIFSAIQRLRAVRGRAITNVFQVSEERGQATEAFAFTGYRAFEGRPPDQLALASDLPQAQQV